MERGTAETQLDGNTSSQVHTTMPFAGSTPNPIPEKELNPGVGGMNDNDTTEKNQEGLGAKSRNFETATYGLWMIVKRVNRRRSKIGNGRLISPSYNGESGRDIEAPNNLHGSRFKMLDDTDDVAQTGHVSNDRAIIPMTNHQPPQPVVMRVWDPKAEKNTQNGPRGKENRNTNAMQGKRTPPKPNQKLQIQNKTPTTREVSPIKILKRDSPMSQGPISTGEAHDDQHAQSIEDKERKAREEHMILEKMRWLSKANPGLGLESIL